VLFWQPLVHEDLGTIGIADAHFGHRLWPYHYEDACTGFDQLVELHCRLAEFAVDELSASRSIDDWEFLGSVYRAGVRGVLSAVLALQHLTAEIEIVTKQPLGTQDLGPRIKAASRLASFPNPTQHHGWQGVPELEAVRHAIEHPTETNTFSPQYWAKVPLAWMLSDRPAKTDSRFREFFEAFASAWVAELANRPAEVRTLEVQRGVYSARPFRRPPR